MKANRWPAMLLVLWLSAAMAQDAVEQPAAGEATEEPLGDELLDAGEEGEPVAPEEELPPAPEPDSAAGEGRINATMERFVPSEQISEDRSVSFPNDI